MDGGDEEEEMTRSVVVVRNYVVMIDGLTICMVRHEAKILDRRHISLDPYATPKK